MKMDIQKTWYFKQPVKVVWEYLTKPELLEQWLMKNNFKPIVGYKFHFQPSIDKECENHGISYCEVLEVTPYEQLSYSWKSGKQNSRTKIDSIVIWTLIEKDNGTELQLQHNGFKVLEDFISHQNGWNEFVNGFIELLTTAKK